MEVSPFDVSDWKFGPAFEGTITRLRLTFSSLIVRGRAEADCQYCGAHFLTGFDRLTDSTETRRIEAFWLRLHGEPPEHFENSPGEKSFKPKVTIAIAAPSSG
jgi:hypothetical protein